MSPPERSRRILLVDDNRSIHEDFRKILSAGVRGAGIGEMEAELFGAPDDGPVEVSFELDSAYQGEEALDKVLDAVTTGRPYAMAFVDVRMPPGWDGIETTEQIWKVDPNIQIVICTAYSDYSWSEMINRLGKSDRLVILKKPFDNVEAMQLAAALTEKWHQTRQARHLVDELEATVKRRTEQLRKSEDRYRLITENAGDLVAVISPGLRWVYRSPSFLRVLGYPPDQLVPLGVCELIHPDDRAAAMAVYRECLRDGALLVRDIRAKHRDGGWLILESHGGPFRNDEGKIEGTIFVARDVTERRKLEMQLRQAQKLESIGQLAAGIAHEINTPMQFVGDNTRFLGRTFGELRVLLDAYTVLFAHAEAGTVTPAVLASTRGAIKTASPEYLREEIPIAVEETLAGVTRITTIVQAMKNFSHPGSTSKSAVDLKEAVEATLTISRNEWRNIADVVTEFDPELPAVPLMSVEFNQVMLNLLINATHAIAEVVGDARKGKGTITITTRRAGEWAEIRLRDTGAGIPRDVQNRIFDPFFTTKPIGKGTGQGLTIARSIIVDRHGGTLEFESTVGQGTVFIVRLPLSAS